MADHHNIYISASFKNIQTIEEVLGITDKCWVLPKHGYTTLRYLEVPDLFARLDRLAAKGVLFFGSCDVISRPCALVYASDGSHVYQAKSVDYKNPICELDNGVIRGAFDALKYAQAHEKAKEEIHGED